MVKQGYRIIDTDTHVGPSIETLQEFAGPELRARWDELLAYYQPQTEGGHFLSIEPMAYKRQMGEPSADTAATRGGKSPLKGSVSKPRPPYEPGVNDLNAEGRLRDMDREGVDVHLIIPGTFAYAVSALDTALAQEIYAAYHRYLDAYCAVDPARLKATVPVSAADPDAAAGDIKRLADAPWAAAVTVVLPEGLPVDDPSLHPIWRALDEHDLPLLHHSFFYEPPYFPGYRDVWDNVVVARCRGPSVGCPTAGRLPGPQRPVRPVPATAHRLLGVQCRLAAGLADPSHRPGPVPQPRPSRARRRAHRVRTARPDLLRDRALRG